MSVSKENKTSRPMVVAVMFVWSGIMVMSLLWNLYEVRRKAVETARIQADMAYSKNIIYRRWNTEHGGVYVEVKDGLKPNPYLKDIPERDVTTPSGKTLTLINPAFMMREIYAITAKEYGMTERIVSLVPLNPDNLPDQWEARALKGIEGGATGGFSEVVRQDGGESLRLIRPLTTEKSCLMCHAAQGYSVGDVQGAISITLPMEHLRATAWRSAFTIATAHGVLWLLGSGAVLLVAMRLRRAELERLRMADELMKAQKLESLGLLAGGIAHDYNNLLTGIMANISLATQVEDTEVRDYKEAPHEVVLESLKDAETATQRAKDLTRQLITFAKGGAPVKELVPDIGALVREQVGFALRGSNVRCNLSLREGLWPVEVDIGQIIQVLQNIIINADQAMPDGGVITIRAENTTLGAADMPSLKPGRYVRIVIEDQGVGIPEKDIHRIFDPYFTTKEEGTGLGLATSYSIVRNHGGDISVKSSTAVGTTFSIYLPASEKNAQSSPQNEKATEAPLREGEGRVLVMDDEELIRKTVCRVLSKAGYEVAQAKDGNEAIDLYQEARQAGRPFDVVIMDLTIPGAGGLGGKETMEELLDLDPGVKAIVSSGYTNDPIMMKYKEYGFKGVMEKPYNIAELRRVVREVIAQNKG